MQLHGAKVVFQYCDKDFNMHCMHVHCTMWMNEITVTRVESGSDDPDNVGHLGHFFDVSSGSHSQTKLSGCDQDI